MIRALANCRTCSLNSTLCQKTRSDIIQRPIEMDKWRPWDPFLDSRATREVKSDNQRSLAQFMHRPTKYNAQIRAKRCSIAVNQVRCGTGAPLVTTTTRQQLHQGWIVALVGASVLISKSSISTSLVTVIITDLSLSSLAQWPSTRKNWKARLREHLSNNRPPNRT